MKVIDLLNKIANGERFENCKMKFKEIKPETVSEYVIYDRLYEEDLTLNDEVEIIEEEQDIEELNKKHFHKKQRQLANKINEIIKEINKLKNK